MYQTLLDLLHSAAYGWPADCAPAPEATAKALATQPPEAVAMTLDSYVYGEMTGRRPSGLATDTDWYRQIVHEAFAEGKEMWENGTARALGLAVEPNADKIAAARSVDEWRRNQRLWRTWDGYVLLDQTPEGEAEMARRKAKAADVPLGWAKKADFWALCVIEGSIPATTDALSAAYAVKSPSLDSVRFLDEQQYLDNLHAAKRKGTVRQKWLSDWSLNPLWSE